MWKRQIRLDKRFQFSLNFIIFLPFEPKIGEEEMRKILERIIIQITFHKVFMHSILEQTDLEDVVQFLGC